MATIKQRIRMFAQWATAVGDLNSTADLKSVAQPDHRTWQVSVKNFQDYHTPLVLMVTIQDDGSCQIKDDIETVLWTGTPTDENFNLVMRDALVKLSD